jgi:FtsP/CotA-like multicopper oxidase with cupredoxin domain
LLVLFFSQLLTTVACSRAALVGARLTATHDQSTGQTASHGFHFLVIGSDGRKLDSPYYKDTIDVAPGERYELLFKLNQVGRYMFHDHIEQNTTNNGESPGGMMTMISVNNPDGSNPVPMQQMMS